MNLKPRRLHVIGKAPEGRAARALVGGIRPRLPEAAQPRQMDVAEARGRQVLGEHFLIELGVVPGTGHCADIGHQGYAKIPQDLDKFRQGAGGMPDGVNQC